MAPRITRRGRLTVPATKIVRNKRKGPLGPVPATKVVRNNRGQRILVPARTEAALVRQLTALRLQLGVSQGQLARKMGTTQPAIAKMEAQRIKNLRFRTVSRAADALGASLQMTLVQNVGRAKSKPAQPRKKK